mgnify:CR=1 FL=1
MFSGYFIGYINKSILNLENIQYSKNLIIRNFLNNVEDKVLIDASSNSGNGGTIVIWSDLKNKKSLTTVKGTLISNGKKAGAIETSGSNLDIKDIKVSLKSSQKNPNRRQP